MTASSRLTGLPHPRDIRRVVLPFETAAVQDPKLHVLLVGFEVVAREFPYLRMPVLFPVQLVRQRSEQAVAVAFDVSQGETQPGHLALHGCVLELELVEVGERGGAGGARAASSGDGVIASGLMSGFPPAPEAGGRRGYMGRDLTGVRCAGLGGEGRK
jgi:hypothetical protein